MHCIIIGIFRSDLACEVMTENITLIKSYGIDLQFLADKFLEKKVINSRERKEVTDHPSGHVAHDKIFDILITSISVEGDVFGIFIDLLKEEDTIRINKLAKLLMNAYERKLTAT